MKTKFGNKLITRTNSVINSIFLKKKALNRRDKLKIVVILF